jgi:hypothetical protein
MRYGLKVLAKLAASRSPAERLRSLRVMRKQIDDGRRPEDYLPLARPLVGDADNDCRWQALIVVGESIGSDPEAVWGVVCEHGASGDEDMRVGVASVLLEHLLEHHFDEYLPRLAERIGAGCPMLADTLGRCWAFGQAVPRWGEVEAVARRAGAR